MSQPELVYSVESVQLSLIKTEPPQLHIAAQGTARTPGFTDPQLVEIVYVTPPADGIYDYHFMATPPRGFSHQTLTPIAAETVRQSIPGDLKGIRVTGQTSSAEAPLAQELASQSPA